MVSRRRFFLATLAGAGALAIGWGVMPPRQRLNGSQRLPAAPGEFPLNGWVKIGSDDRVTVIISKSEMGQGVNTSLSMLLADELDARWDQVRTEISPIDPIYNNIATVIDGLPFHPDMSGPLRDTIDWLTAKSIREMGLMVTGGSSSVKDLWLPMRQAGACARAMLAAAAAQRWSVPVADCVVAEGRVSHPSGKTARFGELAELAAALSPPAQPVLKRSDQFRLIGRDLGRLDTAPKLDGRASFGIDHFEPGMLHARVLMCPTLGGRCQSFDAGAASAMPGVRKVVAIDGHHGGTGAVAVIADAPHRATQALAKLQVRWEPGPAAGFSSDAFLKDLAKVLDRETGHAYFSTGDVEAALRSAARTVSAQYDAPFLAHAALEPMNCTVRVKDGRATVWASTQVPGVARMAAAKALGLDSEQVDLQVRFLGGGFGRRLDVDFIAQAAQIAGHLPGQTVQTVWSREQDTTHDFYRPACVARFTAALNERGEVTGLSNTSAGQAIIPKVLGRYFGLPGVPLDKTTSEGAFDQPYEWPNARIAHQIVDAPVPVGPWRSVGHSHQAFFKESFVDELAAAAGKDPVEFRAALLSRHPRALAVLRLAAEMSRWGSPPAAAADGAKTARGIALHQSFGSVVAQVVEASVGADKRIRVHRVFCAIDCGLPVNPNLIRQQIEGAVVFGLSAALYGRIDIVDGQVRQSNFHDQPVLRIDECPVIETRIVASGAQPEGVGEPGVPPLAPALGNALFALTGQRLRSLPLTLA